jgi:hypothetical protein
MTDRKFGPGLRPKAPPIGERTERYARQIDMIRIARVEVARHAPKTQVEKEQRAADRRVQIERTRSVTKNAKDAQGS